eukprot:COSAG01_NODE_3210_length_6414_cov_54.271417_5_plen_507_part_00
MVREAAVGAPAQQLLWAPSPAELGHEATPRAMGAHARKMATARAGSGRPASTTQQREPRAGQLRRRHGARSHHFGHGASMQLRHAMCRVERRLAGGGQLDPHAEAAYTALEEAEQRLWALSTGAGEGYTQLSAEVTQQVISASPMRRRQQQQQRALGDAGASAGPGEDLEVVEADLEAAAPLGSRAGRAEHWAALWASPPAGGAPHMRARAEAFGTPQRLRATVAAAAAAQAGGARVSSSAPPKAGAAGSHPRRGSGQPLWSLPREAGAAAASAAAAAVPAAVELVPTSEHRAVQLLVEAGLMAHRPVSPAAAAAAADHAQGPSRFWTVLKEVVIPAPHANVCFGRPHTLRRGQVVETVAERMAVSRGRGGAAAAPKGGAHADQPGQEGDERGAAAAAAEPAAPAAAALELLTAWGWVRQRCPDGGGALLAPLRDHDHADDGEVAAAEEEEGEEGEEKRFSTRRRGLGWHWERALAERDRPVRQPPPLPPPDQPSQPASQSGSGPD